MNNGRQGYLHTPLRNNKKIVKKLGTKLDKDLGSTDTVLGIGTLRKLQVMEQKLKK